MEEVDRGLDQHESALYDCLGHIEIGESVLPSCLWGHPTPAGRGSGKPAWALGGVECHPLPHPVQLLPLAMSLTFLPDPGAE